MDPDTTDSNTWAVIGGGMLGLTMALRLAQSGASVTVYEAAPMPGGLTSTTSHADYSWDRFYHVLTSGDHDLLQLLDELELLPAVNWRKTNTNFYDGNNLYPLNNAFDYLTLPALNLVDKLRIAATIVYAGCRSDGSDLERITAHRWLCRWSGNNAYASLWGPLLKSKLGDNTGHASAAYIWSVIRRFYGARKGAARTEQFGYIDGGYARVINTLVACAKRHSVHFEVDARVNRIERNESRLALESNKGCQHFDQVVFTGPSSLVSDICNGLETVEEKAHKSILYQGVICPSVLLRKPLGGAYMTYITDGTIPFTTVIEMSAVTGTTPYGSLHLCYLPRYVPADDPIFERDVEDVEQEFIGGLLRMFPHLKLNDVIATYTAKARNVTAIPTTGYTARLPRVKTSVEGLYVCNSAQIINAALAVNESVELANRSVKEMLSPVQ